jgi:hypothetical protein
MTGRIFQALPTQIDIVALIYRIGFHGQTIFIKFTDMEFDYCLWLIIKKVMACRLAIFVVLIRQVV